MKPQPLPRFSFVDKRLKSVDSGHYHIDSGIKSYASPEASELRSELRSALVAKGHSEGAIGRFTTRVARLDTLKDGYFTIQEGSVFTTASTRATAQSLYEIQTERQQSLIASGEIDTAISALTSTPPENLEPNG